MARAPDSRIEQAKKLFLSGKKLVEIARLLGVPEGTVRSWKNRYQWDCNVANVQTQRCEICPPPRIKRLCFLKNPF